MLNHGVELVKDSPKFQDAEFQKSYFDNFTTALRKLSEISDIALLFSSLHKEYLELYKDVSIFIEN